MASATTPENEVTAAEISRHFGIWQDKAMSAPVIVTRHGKPRLVLLSTEAFGARRPESAEIGDHRNLESAYASLLGHMIEGFIAVDSNLIVTTVNQAFEALVGKAASQLIGQPFHAAFPKAHPMVDEYLRRTLKTGDASEFEAPSTLVPDRMYRIRIFPFAGGVAAVLQSRQEDYETRRQLSALQAQASASERLPGVVWASLTPRGVFSEISGGFAALLGLSARDPRGVQLSQLVKPSGRHAVALAMETCITEQLIRTVEVVMFTRDLGERPVTMVFSPIIAELTVTGVLVAVIDKG